MKSDTTLAPTYCTIPNSLDFPPLYACDDACTSFYVASFPSERWGAWEAGTSRFQFRIVIRDSKPYQLHNPTEMMGAVIASGALSYKGALLSVIRSVPIKSFRRFSHSIFSFFFSQGLHIIEYTPDPTRSKRRKERPKKKKKKKKKQKKGEDWVDRPPGGAVRG
jgi:hypothetical protein